MRTFSSGATRDNDTDKLDYEGFLSPWVLERYAQYMHGHRIQADGNLRDSDNWQKGIPRAAYIKSLFRHFMELWQCHRYGYDLDVTGFDEDGEVMDVEDSMEDALCAIIFNASGYLHVLLEGSEPYGEDKKDPENETLQGNSDSGSSGLPTETSDVPNEQDTKGCNFQPNAQGIPSVSVRDKRVSPERTQADGLSDSKSPCCRVSDQEKLRSILGLFGGIL